MTAVQTARVQGFKASLSKRGLTLRLLDTAGAQTGSPILALAMPRPADGGEFALSKETANETRLGILRTALAGISVVPGNVFQDTTSNEKYRVTDVTDKPIDIAILFDCAND